MPFKYRAYNNDTMFEFVGFNFLSSFISPLVGDFYADIITAFIIIGIFVLIARIFNFTIRRFILQISAKTKSELDDMIVSAISLPIFIAIVLVGVFIALQGLPELAGYSVFINTSFTVFYILFGALIIIRIINVFVQWYAIEVAHRTKTKVDEQFLPVIRRVVLGVVLALALVAILGALGINLDSVVVGLGVGGIAIALAMQDTLSQFFSGAYIIMDRPIKIGDFIELDSGEKGYVTDIGWRSTRIRFLSNNVIIIPNNKLANSKIINYNAPIQEQSVVVPVGVSYHSDLDKVERVTVSVAKKMQQTVEGAVKEHEPFIRYNEFGDSNINFSVILRVQNYVAKYRLVHEFMKALKKEYDRKGIEISWPVRKVYTHRGRGK
jgi:small-conductance mechanosensitive channel